MLVAAALVGAVLLSLAVLWAHLTIDSRVPIVDLAQLAATVFLAFYIPLALERYRDRVRSTRDLLIEDVTRFMLPVRAINEVMTACTHAAQTTERDRMRIRTAFLTANRKLGPLEQRIRAAGSHSCMEPLKELRAAYDGYWKAVTGGSLYGSGQVDWDLWRTQEFAFGALEHAVSGLLESLRTK
jgi:hypothetical protein